jgi:adenylate kinase
MQELRMVDLAIIGGAKGVGKSSLIQKVSEQTGKPSINTGEIFLRARREGLNFETELQKAFVNHYGLVDTHYVGYSGCGFIRGMSEELLLGLKGLKSIDLVLVDLDLDTLMQRRSTDLRETRIFNPEHAGKELEMNRYYFNEYCKEITIKGLIVKNYNLDAAAKEIARRVV